MLGIFNRTLKDDSGATLVEFSLLMVLLFAMTFSVLEGGFIFYQYNSAQKATHVGARYAATRAPVVTGLSDCGVSAVGHDAGTDCSSISGSDTWSVTCTHSGGGSCDTVQWQAVLTEMREVYPFVKQESLEITFSGTGLGFHGRNKPVPAITVALKDIDYNYIAIGQLLDLGTVFNITDTQTTVIAEDIGEGTG